jgi:hypothetical protein
MSYNYIQPYLGLSNGIQTMNSGAGGGGGVGGWVELGRTTLGSSGDNITVSSLADKRYYMVLVDCDTTGGNARPTIRMGNGSTDTGSNYASRRNENGGTDATNTSSTQIYQQNLAEAVPQFQLNYIANLSGKEKLTTGWWCDTNAAGAANAPARSEFVGKWVNTSNPLDVIDIFNDEAGSFSTGSECVVLGWDESDTHTTNFWEELDSVDLSGGAATSLTSNAFTSKKYLWIQCYVDMTTTQNPAYRIGNTTLDTGSNYSTRDSQSGGTDNTRVSQTFIHSGINTGNMFTNFFIVNNASNEKLMIQHGVQQETAGAGNAPSRTERVHKWAQTSSQADIFGLINTGSGNFGTGTIMKIWGSD